MDRVTWDLYSPAQKHRMVLNAIAKVEGSGYSFNADDGKVYLHLWFMDRPFQLSCTINDVSVWVETFLKHRGLHSRYMKELFTILAGEKEVERNELGPILLATPDDRLLAALNTLEGSK